VTDDAELPRPGFPGGADGTPPEVPRPRTRPGDDGPATEALSRDAVAEDDAATQAFRWDAGTADDATQALRWNPDAAVPPRAVPPDAGVSQPDLPDTEPTPVDLSLDGAPSLDAQPPTEAMAFETAVVPAVSPGGPLPRTSAPGTDAPTGAIGIDVLFQPGQFRDFEPTDVLRPVPRPAGATAVRGARTRPSLTSGQRSLLWAAGVLVVILVLLALFSIGRRLPAMFAAPPTPVATATATPTPTPTPVDAAAGPVAPGEYAWDELRGGECLQPYESAWQEDYTVVDCGAPHAAQLLVRAEFPEEAAPGGVYPGFDELAGRINLLCTHPAVIDYGVARQFDDFVVEGAHAVNAEEWDAGHTEYFCFLKRSSGEPLNASLAVPPGK
jgi:hypothetical protein